MALNGTMTGMIMTAGASLLQNRGLAKSTGIDSAINNISNSFPGFNTLLEAIEASNGALGGIGIDKGGIAALLGHFQRMQHGAFGRYRLVGGIRMPLIAGVGRANPFPVDFLVRQDQHLRVFFILVGFRNVKSQLAKMQAELLLLDR